MSNAIATCVASDGWSFNSRGQSPCVVATELAKTCVNDFRLPPLEEDFVYLGPTPNVANPCRCNSVYYSMLSACAECQDRNWVRWSRYNFNCSEVYLMAYPNPIPVGISVPSWAYIDVSIDDNFNVTRAQLATGPESSPPPRPSQTGGGNTNNPGNGGGDNGGGKTNVGAIAGGVIGGVVFLALVGLLVFFLLRRRKQKETTPEVYNQTTGGAMSTFSAGAATYAAPTPGRVYDPNDPTTWPSHQDALATGNSAPVANTYPSNNAPYLPVPQQATGTAYSQPGYPHMQPQYQNAPQQPMPQPTGGRYTGVPEL